MNRFVALLVLCTLAFGALDPAVKNLDSGKPGDEPAVADTTPTPITEAKERKSKDLELAELRQSRLVLRSTVLKRDAQRKKVKQLQREAFMASEQTNMKSVITTSARLKKAQQKSRTKVKPPENAQDLAEAQRLEQIEKKVGETTESVEKQAVSETSHQLKQLKNPRLQKQFQDSTNAWEKANDLSQKASLEPGSLKKQRLEAMKGEVKSLLFLGELNKQTKLAARNHD